jgi:hypothetical protein
MGNGTTGTNRLVLVSIDAQSTGTEPTGTGTAFVRINREKGV